MSFSLQTCLLRLYSLTSSRKTRRAMATSEYSSGRAPSSLENRKTTSARLIGLRSRLPAKITSSILLPRTSVGRCSPSTQRIASEMLLLPHPLGPTMAVIPGLKSIATRSANDLNPYISRRWSFTPDSSVGWGRVWSAAISSDSPREYGDLFRRVRAERGRQDAGRRFVLERPRPDAEWLFAERVRGDPARREAGDPCLCLLGRRVLPEQERQRSDTHRAFLHDSPGGELEIGRASCRERG